VRIRLMAVILVAAGASVIGAAPGAAEDRTAPRGHAAASIQTVSSNPITHLSQFADQTPDGSQLIELYKAARTVADVEAANARVKDQVLQAQSVGSELVRLHAAKMTACENVDASHVDATAGKATAFSATLIKIEQEITKSLSTMRQKVAAERSVSTRAKDDVNRYAVAAHEFSRLNLQTQEITKAIQSVARNIRTAAQSCMPTPIPPLFVEGSTPPSGVISARRSHPTRRKRPANAAVRRAPSIFRYY
jgi:hypothetical protein